MDIEDCVLKITAITFVLVLSIAQGFSAELCVSHEGKDGNPGTRERPFVTLARARDAVRKRLAMGLKEDVTVLIRGGTYELSETLVFGPEDSGTEKYSVTYAAFPGESVVVSGGRRIGGWKKEDGKLWTARVAGVKEGKWYPRHLFVNGRRATRARMPNLHASTPMVQMQAAKVSKDIRIFTVTFAAGIVKNWRNPGDMELMMQGNWAINRKRVESLDEKAGVITLAPPHVAPLQWNTPRRGRWCFFENAREFLDHPCEWYLDRQTGTVSYWPRQDEDMAKAEVVAPRLTRLLEVVGTPERPVRNLHFKGICFQHADWPLPAGGYMGVQACHFYTSKDGKKTGERIDAAIHWDYVESSSVTDGVIAHIGGIGIALVKGCRRNVIEGNHIFDISASGVMLGGPKDEPNVPKDNRIANNHVHACGIDFHGAVGIWVGFAERASIAHNLVHDLPYTGISMGWQWNPQPTPCKENTVEYNHIYDVMKRLSDGGGIYTLGFQPGTVIRGNHIHEVRRSRYAHHSPNNGMFIDQGSKGFLFERNVIYNTAGRPVRHNQNSPEGHTWKDNHFSITPHIIGTALLCDGASNFVEVPHSPKLEPEQLTVETWIHLAKFPGGNDPRRWIVNKNRNEWVEGHYALMINRDSVGAYLNIGGGQHNEHSAWSPKGALKLYQWHHLAMTYDSADMKVYLDGRQVAAKRVNRRRKRGNTALAIGRRQDAYNYFKGAIDEVRIYNRALDVAELKVHHAKPAHIKDIKGERGLVGYWSFEDLTQPQTEIEEVVKKAGLEPGYREKMGQEK